jgi:ankyrin repeat protein
VCNYFIDSYGATALHRAIKAEHQEVGANISGCIRELIERGSDLNITDKDGCNVLHFCARYGQPEYIAELVDLGVKINCVSKGDFTALHWSALLGAVTCLVKLIQMGANIDATTKTGAHALHLAASVGKLNCLEKLKEEFDKQNKRKLVVSYGNLN